MSELGAESRAELIARRDEVIELLQGEWEIDKELASVNRKAIRLGVFVFVAGLVFAAVLFPCIYFISHAQGRVNLLNGIFGFGFTMFALMSIFGGIVFGGVHIEAWWHRQLKPIVVDGHHLVWNKKKGFVPERVNLHTLHSVFTVNGDDPVFDPAGSILMKTIGLLSRIVMPRPFGGPRLPAEAPHEPNVYLGGFILLSPNEHNTPKISPAMFVEGNRLIHLLFDVAAFNTKINELEEESA